mgnify:FL=1
MFVVQMNQKLCRLSQLADGVLFVFARQAVDDATVYESRGNGWYGVFGKTENGGPWCDPSALVLVEVESGPRTHPAP